MKQRLFLIPLIFLILAFVAGCGQKGPPRPEREPKTYTEPAELKVVLYFGDREAQYLLPEKRTVNVPPGQTVLEAVVRELLAGPQVPDAAVLLPEGTELLGVEAESGIITVDFNEKLRDEFFGGSSSEGLLIYSVVNTLTGLEGYRDYKVRFLINGETFESIGGHISAEELFERNETLIAK